MNRPLLTEIPTSRTTVDVFGGYNHNLRIAAGEFFNMENMTSDRYPILSPRSPRGVYLGKTEAGYERNIQGLIAKDHLCYVEDGRLYINGNDAGLSLSATGEKQLVSMGAYICIFPDGQYINTVDYSDCGFMAWKKTVTDSVTFTPCKDDGTDLDAAVGTEPESPKDGQYWMDTTVTPNALKVWSSINGMWTQVATSYVRISTTEAEEDAIGYGFSEFDGVEITGLEDHTNRNLAEISGNFVIQSVAEDRKSIVIIGLLDDVVTVENTPVTIQRKVPEMDFVVESENRLFGCKYGFVNGRTVNEIYACKLGDFKNWNCFQGISTDSFASSVGSDGPFTGAISYLGFPLFFKEECLHKVYGNYPANFQIQELACRGVQKGCGKSLAIVDESVYYKSKSGVCVYDGSFPSEISAAFGESRYGSTTPEERLAGIFGACGGSNGGKYYISMRQDGTGTYHLFVYDARRGMWHREDSLKVDAFCSCGNELYMAADGLIYTCSGNPGDEEVCWSVETGDVGLDTPDKKRLSRLSVRLAADPGSEVRIFADYDSVGNWTCVYGMNATALRSVTVRIPTRRHDHLRLRFEGRGAVKIYSITKTIDVGSDL